MERKVIVTARSFGKTDSLAKDLLEKNGFEVIKLVDGEESLRSQTEREIVDADAVIAGLEEFDAPLIASAKKLKVISRYGVGYDKVDLAVGVVLHKKVGDHVDLGESLGTIHARTEEAAAEAVMLLRGCYELTDKPVKRAPFIKGVVR